MDLAFLRRAERMLARPEGSPAIDYGVLVAALAAHQAATGTARAAGGAAARCWPAANGPLVELLVGGPAWREAARAMRGSFDRRAAADVNRS